MQLTMCIFPGKFGSGQTLPVGNRIELAMS